jgi:hypothetical protein
MTAPKKAQDVSGYARQKARSTLLRTIETIAPEVVKSLKELDPFDWAAKWFGGVEWAHRQAERTLDVWRDFPKSESRGEFGRYGGVLYRGMDVPDRSDFSYKPWNPNREDRGPFRQRILRAFTARLDEELDAQEERATPPDVPAFRNLDRDAAWLAHYQFGRLSYTRIAHGIDGSERADPTTVRKAVQALATVVELNLRTPDSAGRPTRRLR